MSNVEQIMGMAKVTGKNIETYEVHNGKCFYVIEMTANSHIVVVPDDVEYFMDKDAKSDFNAVAFSPLRSYYGKIKAIGGNGLRSTESMFEESRASEIDISELNMSNVVDMSFMFGNMHENISKLDLGDIDTSNVEIFHCAFSSIKAKELDLSRMQFKNAVNISGLFQSARINQLKIGKLAEAQNVRTMDATFAYSTIGSYIDLSEFNPKHIISMGFAFANCDITGIDLSTLLVHNDTSTSGIFDQSNICNLRIKDKRLKKLWKEHKK